MVRNKDKGMECKENYKDNQQWHEKLDSHHDEIMKLLKTGMEVESVAQVFCVHKDTMAHWLKNQKRIES